MFFPSNKHMKRLSMNIASTADISQANISAIQSSTDNIANINNNMNNTTTIDLSAFPMTVESARQFDAGYAVSPLNKCYNNANMLSGTSRATRNRYLNGIEKVKKLTNSTRQRQNAARPRLNEQQNKETEKCRQRFMSSIMQQHQEQREKNELSLVQQKNRVPMVQNSMYGQFVVNSPIVRGMVPQFNTQNNQMPDSQVSVPTYAQSRKRPYDPQNWVVDQGSLPTTSSNNVGDSTHAYDQQSMQVLRRTEVFELQQTHLTQHQQRVNISNLAGYSEMNGCAASNCNSNLLNDMNHYQHQTQNALSNGVSSNSLETNDFSTVPVASQHGGGSFDNHYDVQMRPSSSSSNSAQISDLNSLSLNSDDIDASSNLPEIADSHVRTIVGSMNEDNPLSDLGYGCFDGVLTSQNDEYNSGATQDAPNCANNMDEVPHISPMSIPMNQMVMSPLQNSGTPNIANAMSSPSPVLNGGIEKHNGQLARHQSQNPEASQSSGIVYNCNSNGVPVNCSVSPSSAVVSPYGIVNCSGTPLPNAATYPSNQQYNSNPQCSNYPTMKMDQNYNVPRYDVYPCTSHSLPLQSPMNGYMHMRQESVQPNCDKRPRFRYPIGAYGQAPTTGVMYPNGHVYHDQQPMSVICQTNQRHPNPSYSYPMDMNSASHQQPSVYPYTNGYIIPPQQPLYNQNGVYGQAAMSTQYMSYPQPPNIPYNWC